MVDQATSVKSSYTKLMHLGNEKRVPRCLGAFFGGDEKLLSYTGIIINHEIRIPMKNNQQNWCYPSLRLPFFAIREVA